MAPQIHQAASAGAFHVIEPLFVRAVGVMEYKVSGIDVTKPAAFDQLVQFEDSVGETVGEISLGTNVIVLLLFL
ncbi:MAG: hypothetical protein A2X80_07500 [Geobacteraceae bacterium GWB2_52_12]|nr:MAG: hypothetical protein A2X80_07500 [Geobacteraceae bacterium GWB2_52_12]